MVEHKHKDHLKYVRGFSSRANHIGQAPDPATGAVIRPLYLSSTYILDDNFKTPPEYFYSRLGHPNRKVFEECIASLENGKYAVAASSGLAASSLVTHLLKPGDEVICAPDIYGGTHGLFSNVIEKNQGLVFKWVNFHDLEAFEAAFTDKTKMVWVETPSNPVMAVYDLEAIVKITRKRPDILITADNTFMSPYLQNPLDFGVDICLHSGTKYIGGHTDVLLGVLIMNDEDLYKQLKERVCYMGPAAQPMECYLATRGLKTLKVRMEACQANAQKLAEELEKHPKIEKVFYPGLPSHKNYEVQKKQARGGGAMIAMRIKGDLEHTKHFAKEVTMMVHCVSLGGVETMYCIPALSTHLPVPHDVRESLGITDNFVRISVGLEEYEDIKADIFGALEHM